MSDVFTTTPDLTPYIAVIPGSLCAPPVNADLVPGCQVASAPRTTAVKPLHDGAWWAHATQDFNFKQPDAINSSAFSHVLWRGTMGNRPYPSRRFRPDDEDAQVKQCSNCGAESSATGSSRKR
jgi:DNA-binding beta-propeller fold protein YncE